MHSLCSCSGAAGGPVAVPMLPCCTPCCSTSGRGHQNRLHEATAAHPAEPCLGAPATLTRRHGRPCTCLSRRPRAPPCRPRLPGWHSAGRRRSGPPQRGPSLACCQQIPRGAATTAAGRQPAGSRVGLAKPPPPPPPQRTRRRCCMGRCAQPAVALLTVLIRSHRIQARSVQRRQVAGSAGIAVGFASCGPRSNAGPHSEVWGRAERVANTANTTRRVASAPAAPRACQARQGLAGCTRGARSAASKGRKQGRGGREGGREQQSGA